MGTLLKRSIHFAAGMSLFLNMTSVARAADEAEFSSWGFKVSGEERFRAEHKQDFDLNGSLKDNGNQFYNRFRLGLSASLTDEYLKPKVDVFIEGLDAQTGGYRIKAASNQVDDMDLHQAYVNVSNILGSDFSIKAGRQEMKYGKGRLIASPVWANRIRALDGGVLHYQHEGLWADLLYGQDVKYDNEKFNTSRSEDFLSGIYGGFQKHKIAPLVETYFLSQTDLKGTNDTARYTVGARLVMKIIAGITMDVEIPYQFGHTGSATVTKKDIRAYAFHVDLSKSWESSTWKPKLSLAYDDASGDQDASDTTSNTFVPLYQTTHDPYGIIDLFRWQNVRNPEISATFFPTDKFRFATQADFFWLNSKADSWYNSSGSAFRTNTQAEHQYVGWEASLRGCYAFSKNVNAEAGYAHFFTGGYASDTGADDDIDWFYTQLAIKF